jgi:hypothetical protein
MPTLNWLTREADLQKSRRAPYRLLEPVEYKGEHIVDAADAREKRNLGALWEEKSAGKGLFLMAEKRDATGRDLPRQLANKVRR